MAFKGSGVRIPLPPPSEISKLRTGAAFLIQDGGYIDASQDEILKTFGSMNDYLDNGLGFSQQEVKQLQDRLLR